MHKSVYQILCDGRDWCVRGIITRRMRRSTTINNRKRQMPRDDQSKSIYQYINLSVASVAHRARQGKADVPSRTFFFFLSCFALDRCVFESDTGGRLDGSAARCDVDSVGSAKDGKSLRKGACAWPGPCWPGGARCPAAASGTRWLCASLPALGVGDEPASCAFKLRGQL